MRTTKSLAIVLLFFVTPAFADYTVSGKFLYEDRAYSSVRGFTGATDFRPIRFADVQVRAVSGGTVLATGATNASGDYSISVQSNTNQLIQAVCVTTSTATSGLLLDVRVAYDNLTFGGYYTVASNQIPTTGSGIVTMGTTWAAANTDAGRAFNIWDVCYDGMEFAASLRGSFPASRLTAIWRSSHRLAGAGSFYLGGTDRSFWIDVGSAQDDPVIAHQFGHFMVDVFSQLDTPGPELLPVFRFGFCSDDIRVAWSEGSAIYFGSMIRRFKGYPRPDFYFYSTTNGRDLAYMMEIESLSSPVQLPSRTGSTNPLAVAAALWDITDGPASDDATPGSDDDPLSKDVRDLWNVLTNYMRNLTSPGISVERFWDGWFSMGLGSPSEMSTVFVSLNGIEVTADAQESDNTPGAAPLVQPAVLTLASGPRVVINEIDTGDVDVIELFNAGDTEADLTGWTVSGLRSGAVPALLEMPSFRLKPGAFVRLSEAQGGYSSSILYFNTDIPWLPGSDGACILRDRSGAGKDFVRWGDSREFPPGGTSFTGANPPAPSPGRTLGRSYSGSDGDAGSDWSPQDPSPGTFNLGGPEKHHTFYPAADADFAAFNAVSGRTYVVEALNLGNGADTILEILGANGSTVLASMDDVGQGLGSRLGWSAPTPGKYYVAVRRFSGASNPARYGSYDLRIIEGPAGMAVAGPEILNVSRGGQQGRYNSLASAIAAAGNGDTVQIADSETYVENVKISGKSITLKAAPGQSPVLDGRQRTDAASLSLGNNKSVTIDGISILGGSRGIRISNSAASIKNTLVYRVSGVADADGIQVIGEGATAAIINSTVVNNARLGIGVFNGASARVVNSIVRDNPTGNVGGDGTAASLTVKNSLVIGGGYAGKDGNIEGDPLFVNAAGNDYRLQATSPCVDKGDGTADGLPLTDALGLPRKLDGDGNGTALPDMGAYEYLSASSLTSTAVFPQIAAGGEYRTSIIGVNTGTQSALVNVVLTKSDGSPFQVTVDGRTASTFTELIPPGGTTRLETSSSAGVTAGYAKLLSNVSLTGSAVFKTIRGETIVSEAGVGLSKPTRSFLVYLDYTNSAYSGYAIANPGTAPAGLTLRLRANTGGDPVATANVTLSGGRHMAEFAIERFGSVVRAGFEGSLEVTSDRDVCAVALRYDNWDSGGDVFSTIPVLVDEAASTLYFPQVADGGGYRNNFILVNPSSAATTARLEFFDDDGNPLSLPIGGAGRISYDVPLAARGVARFVTDGTSQGTKVGWARVTCPQPIGGSAIFQTMAGSRITSEAGVSSSPLSSRFTTVVENHSSPNLAWAGLAVANPNSGPVGVSLSLRDSEGNLVTSTNFNLPPHGHKAGFVTEWFGAGYADFEGTLEVVGSGSISGVALRYDNPGLTVFATVPVIVTQ